MVSLLEKLEDPDRPLLGPNYWMLKNGGFLLPKTKIAKVLYMIMHEIVALFTITQYVEVYVIRSDLDLVLTNLKISMLAFICVIKVNTFILWRKDWRDVLEYVTAADKFERENQNLTRQKIIDTYTKYSRFVTNHYVALTFTTFIFTIITPLLRYLSSSNLRENFRNGTEPFPHIFSSWMPFDKYHPPGCWITVVWHAWLSFVGAMYMAAFDTSVVVIMVFFGGKIDLLRERCQQLFSNSGSGISDKEFRKEIGKLHKIHTNLLKYSRLFNSLLSPVMFIYMLMCSLTICASAYQITVATNLAQVLLSVEYLVFGLSQLFLFCWHSNEVSIKNEDLASGAYDSEWWAANLSQKRSLLMLIGQLRIHHIFTAGPFTSLTIPTFIKILKGSYSYYALLRE